MILSSAGNAQAQNIYYVRSGASGANNGSDWTNAYKSLPSSLVRGATYYVGGGNYPAYVFDDPMSGTNYITVKKATAADHGTDTGWNSSFGSGVATWGLISFSTGYWVFDGVTGGGPASWTTGHGFKIRSSNEGNDYFVHFRNSSASNIRISHVDIGNDTQPTPSCDQILYSISGAINNTFSYCYLHNTGDLGVRLGNASGWVFEYTRMDRLATGGANTVCGTIGQINHGAGITLTGTSSNITIRHNNISNMVSTGWIGIYKTINPGSVDGFYIYGNIFHNTPDYSGTWGNGVIYHESAALGPLRNIKIYNNTFANLNHPAILYNKLDTSGNEFVNNIVYNVAGTPNYSGYTRSYNTSDKPIPGDSHIMILSFNPFVDSSNGNFHLKSNTQGGANLGSPYNIDMDGHARTTWTKGAYEYVMWPNGDVMPPSGLKIIQE